FPLRNQYPKLQSVQVYPVRRNTGNCCPVERDTGCPCNSYYSHYSQAARSSRSLHRSSTFAFFLCTCCYQTCLDISTAFKESRRAGIQSCFQFLSCFCNG